MLPAELLTTITTLALALLVLGGAVCVVTLSNLFRAALCLGVVLVGVAACFLLVQAEFLAFVQILVYVGAVLTLIVFAIMLTARITEQPSGPARRQGGLAAVVSLALFALLAVTTQTLAWPQPAQEPIPLGTLGQQLVTTFVLPFEVVSLVLVAALVGSVALAASPRRAPPTR